ncbi:Molybdopterin oxidoreductase Fe4S4 domain-containing protein [Streptomyces sp. Termitarium-T10T-6]|nr:Molybdopterin oxidoreductase Fe4S4 domain-containing protein [Streptomyces sp. Termitarium-T10T-6]
MSHDSRTAPRICPLCEATCGLTLTIEGTTVTGARGDRDDIFSRGFICPKGASFGGLDADPDRLRVPLVRGEDGELREAAWGEAFDLIAARIPDLVKAHGPQAVGVVLGNPNVHTMAGFLYPPLLLGALRTRNVFTASTLDQMPKHVSSGLLFGDAHAIPVPDLDRTGHLLLIGANPLESNGSLCTAPDFPGRLKALRRRGGTLTVIDPRRTRTARLADRHVAIRPGADALLLAAVAHTLIDEKLADPGPLAEHLDGLDELAAALADFTPDAVAAACDVDADTITAIARELAAAPTAAVYGRIGSCTVEHGTLASWLVDVLNILTGNLDRPGGALFPLSATARAPRAAGPGTRNAAPGTRNAAPGNGLRARPLVEPGLRAPRGQGRTAHRRPRRGDRLPGRGPYPRPGGHRGQPRALRARRRPARRGPRRRARLHGQRRPVPQRDLPPRRRRPCPRRRPRRAPTSTSRSTTSPYTTRSATPAPPSPWRTGGWTRARSTPG